MGLKHRAQGKRRKEREIQMNTCELHEFGGIESGAFLKGILDLLLGREERNKFFRYIYILYTVFFESEVVSFLKIYRI